MVLSLTVLNSTPILTRLPEMETKLPSLGCCLQLFHSDSIVLCEKWWAMFLAHSCRWVLLQAILTPPPFKGFIGKKLLGKVESEQSEIVLLSNEMIFKWQKTVSDNCKTYNTLLIRWLSKAAFHYFWLLNFGITTGKAASKSLWICSPLFL